VSERFIKLLLLSIGSGFMVFFCLFPFLYMLLISLGENPTAVWKGTGFLTLDNYREVLQRESLHFIDYLRNSMVVSSVSALFSVLISSLSAYAVTRLSFPGRLFLLFFVLAVSLFPPISIVGYLFKLMSLLGLINTYSSLILPYISLNLPLSLWILTSYFSQIPLELDRAALVDGASRWRILFRIILPVALPGVFSAFLLSFIFSFNEFILALTLTTDYRARTVPVGIALFQGLHGETPWGTIMAASVITILPIVLLTVLFQKYIIGGLTRGAVKG